MCCDSNGRLGILNVLHIYVGRMSGELLVSCFDDIIRLCFMYPVRFFSMSGAVLALAEFAIFARKLRVCNMPSKADALEAAHGDEVRQLYRIHTTARRLKIALEERRPPLFYTDGVLKQWISKYSGVSGNFPPESRQR